MKAPIRNDAGFLTADGPASIEPSAIIEARSTSKGVLVSRMTTTQRDAIASPANGLLIYNISTGQFEFYKASIGWVPVNSEYNRPSKIISLEEPGPYTILEEDKDFFLVLINCDGVVLPAGLGANNNYVGINKTGENQLINVGDVNALGTNFTILDFDSFSIKNIIKETGNETYVINYGFGNYPTFENTDGIDEVLTRDNEAFHPLKLINEAQPGYNAKLDHAGLEINVTPSLKTDFHIDGFTKRRIDLNSSLSIQPVSSSVPSNTHATLLMLYESGTIATREYAELLIEQILDGAPEEFDTLKKLSDQVIALSAILDDESDSDSVVNKLAEILAVFATYPEGVDLITAFNSKVNAIDVYNALDRIPSGKVLDARQGKVLKDLIDSLSASVTGLQLSQVLLNDTTTSSALTGTTSNTIIKSYVVPGIVFANLDLVKFYLRGLKSGTAGGATFGIYINTSNTLTGATKIAGFNGSSAIKLFECQRTMVFKSGTSMEGFTSGTNNYYDLGGDASGAMSFTYDASQQYYIMITGLLVNGADSLFQSYCGVRRIKSKTTF